MPLRHHIPNALTILRFAAIPLFAWLYAEAGDGAAWGAGVVFGLAAITDQLDGYLARIGAGQGWLVRFDQRASAAPLPERVRVEEVRTGSGRTVMLLLL